MQADSKLPAWSDDADLVPQEQAPTAVVVPFPSPRADKRAAKKAADDLEIQEAIKRIEARKRQIKREQLKHADDDDEDAPVREVRPRVTWEAVNGSEKPRVGPNFAALEKAG